MRTLSWQPPDPLTGKRGGRYKSQREAVFEEPIAWEMMARTKGLSRERFLPELSERARHRFVSERPRQVRY